MESVAPSIRVGIVMLSLGLEFLGKETGMLWLKAITIVMLAVDSWSISSIWCRRIRTHGIVADTT